MYFLVVVFLCVLDFSNAKESYRIGVIGADDRSTDLKSYMPLINKAGQKNVDIVILPSGIETSERSYGETVKELADAAKESRLYVVAHLFEKTRCQNKDELIRSSLVFDRAGTVVAVYRKPMSAITNCTDISAELKTVKTDFDITFGLLMPEDLVMKKPDFVKNIDHFIVTGKWEADEAFLNTDQFASSWAYINKMNVISPTGIYFGRAGIKKVTDNDLTVDISLTGPDLSTPPVVNPTKSFIMENLNQYTVKAFDVDASRSSLGYRETVCHNNFCCEFHIKTSFVGKETNYGLAVFDGVTHFGSSHYIGIQNCGVYACVGFYKRSCDVGSENRTNIIFEKITITANSTQKNTDLYPKIVSTQSIRSDQFSFIRSDDQTTTTLRDASVLSFGIFGRDYSKDTELLRIDGNVEGINYYDYIFNDSVIEFFDYLWIRLRILLFVASIYILEMM